MDETTRVYDSVFLIAKSQALHVCRRRLTKTDWTLHKEGFDLLLIHCGEVLAEDSEVRGSFWHRFYLLNGLRTLLLKDLVSDGRGAGS